MDPITSLLTLHIYKPIHFHLSSSSSFHKKTLIINTFILNINCMCLLTHTLPAFISIKACSSEAFRRYTHHINPTAINRNIATPTDTPAHSAIEREDDEVEEEEEEELLWPLFNPSIPADEKIGGAVPGMGGGVPLVGDVAVGPGMGGGVPGTGGPEGLVAEGEVTGTGDGEADGDFTEGGPDGVFAEGVAAGTGEGEADGEGSPDGDVTEVGFDEVGPGIGGGVPGTGGGVPGPGGPEGDEITEVGVDIDEGADKGLKEGSSHPLVLSDQTTIEAVARVTPGFCTRTERL
mmetsp:Transcript_28721/g.39498  ORF Transcript_28721/g.39498 Transcript_28721/m.39498 type:complete len:291 (+) Transcript_28721:146-1018(+)